MRRTTKRTIQAAGIFILPYLSFLTPSQPWPALITAAETNGAPIVFKDEDPRSSIGGDRGVPIRLRIPKEDESLIIRWEVVGDSISTNHQISRASQPPSLFFRSVGSSSLIAFIDGQTTPVASRMIHSYNSVFFGCAAFTDKHDIRFSDDGRESIARTIQDADLYVTAPKCDFWNSPKGAFDAPGEVNLHIPYGGIVIPEASLDFDRIEPSRWEHRPTSVRSLSVGDGLLIKTRSGRVVKLIPGSSTRTRSFARDATIRSPGRLACSPSRTQ